MSIDLQNMSRKELNALSEKIEKALQDLEKRELAAAREAAEKAVAALGFTLDDITGGKSKKGKTGTKGPAKFKNPNDPSQTWSGKGRQPQWFKDAMAAGATPESLAI